MKKGQQIVSIVGLFLATIVLLVVIFVRYYENDGKNLIELIAQVQSEISVSDTQKENMIENTTEDTTEETEAEDTESGQMHMPATEMLSTEIEDSVPLEFVASDKSYFDDALFIGDSRCVGIEEYGTLDNATFFVLEGLGVRNMWSKTISIETLGKVNLQELLETQTYAKIYVMLGINEIGYNQDDTAAKYKEMLDKIHALAPDAIIYVCSNLHVTEKRSSKDETFNNRNIDAFNEKIQAFTDHEIFFYLDVNEMFNDDAGNLIEEYTSDQVHLLAKYYQEWSEWFCEKTIQKNNNENPANTNGEVKQQED